MLFKTDWLIEQQIAQYFSRLSTPTKIDLLKRSPSVSMNEDEETDADDLVSEVETDRTRKKIRRDLQKTAEDCRGRYNCHRLRKIQTFASHFSFKFMVITDKNVSWIFSSREICVSTSCMGNYYPMYVQYRNTII